MALLSSFHVLTSCPGVCKLGDLKTYELMKSVDDALFAKLGRRAHKVALKVHRKYIDANR